MAPRVTQVRASPGKATEGADGVPGRPGRESGTKWGQRCHQSRGQSVSKRMVRGFGWRAALRAVGGHRRSPSWLGLSVNSGFLGIGRAGGHRGGRRKPVHGGLAAASMPRTPPRCPPARPLTGSCAASHGRQNKKSKAKAGRCALQCLTSEISLVAGQWPALPGSIHAWRGSTADRGNLSKAGWVRLRGRERHGWRDRAYKDVFTASPATGPTPPSHGNPAFALAVAVAVALASAGAGRRPAKALPPLPVQCRARFPTTVPRT